MNFIEAVKSGKPFKRPNFTFYLRPEYDIQQFSFKREDFLADDWVVEEKEATITTSQFDEAVKRIGNLYHQDQWYWADAIKKELGL